MDNKNELLKEIMDKGIQTGDILKYLSENKIDKFKELHRWSSEDRVYYQQLLDSLQKTNGDKNVETGTKGKVLENLVNFVIKKTYFFEVYKNIRTGTNEIDQVIRLSSQGVQAIKQLELDRELLQVNEDIFLGECKNYSSTLGVTYVGKFYGLLKVSDCSFGIIFSVNGLSGKTDAWKEAQGLIKVFRLIEKYEKGNPNFYIIDFNMDDYIRIGQGISFFDIIKEKKTAIQLSTKYENLLFKSEIEEKKEVIEAVKELKKRD